MELKKIKNISIISGLIFFTSFVLSYLNVFKNDLTGYKGLFEFIVLSIFMLSTLILFIKLDIKLDKFVYLKSLNYLALIIGLSTFIYWGFIKSDAFYLLFPAYTVIFMICNNILMSIIYLAKNTGKKYIYMEWIILTGSICIYLLLPKLLIYLDVIKKE